VGLGPGWLGNESMVVMERGGSMVRGKWGGGGFAFDVLTRKSVSCPLGQAIQLGAWV
jgi:hypothetical protein